MKKKEKSLAQLNRVVQLHFNKFIRNRDKVKDKWICISCGEEKDKIHAGHYFPVKGYPHMRFDEENVNSQCAGCNTYKAGNIQMYRRGLLKKIGPERLDALEHRAIDGERQSLNRDQLLKLIEIYKNKADILFKK